MAANQISFAIVDAVIGGLVVILIDDGGDDDEIAVMRYIYSLNLLDIREGACNAGFYRYDRFHLCIGSHIRGCLSDANIYEAKGRLPCIKHWEKEAQELDAAIREAGADKLQGIREEIDDVTNIRAKIDSVLDTLADMNALPPGHHQGTNFEALLDALAKRLNQ
jgi:hypothetical protein